MKDISDIESILKSINSGDIIKRPDPEDFNPELRGIIVEIAEVVKGFEALHEGDRVLSLMAENDYTERVNGKYEGIFLRIAESINIVQDRLLNLQDVAEKIGDGDLSKLQDFKNIGGGTGKRSANDKILPAFIAMMESIRGVVDEVETLGENAVLGNLGYRGDVSKHRGAFSEVVESVNHAVEAFIIPMNEAIRVCGIYAMGDFSAGFDKKIKISGDFINFEEAVDNIGVQVSNAVNQANSISEQVSINSNEVSKGTDEVSRAAEGVAMSSQKTADLTGQLLKKMEEINYQIADLSASNEEIAGTSQEVFNAANNVVEIGKDAQKAGDDANKKMVLVEDIAQKSVVEISDLTEKIKEVNNVVKLINDITSQINLLALNAAIEAARAGEHGRGFAVVAGEVKNLAAEAREATENIEKVVSTVQSSSEKTATAIKSANTEIMEGVKSVNTAIDALNIIIKDAEQVSHDIGEITHAIENQANIANAVVSVTEEGADMTKKAQKETEELAALAEEASASVEEIGSAVHEVSELAKALKAEMDKFKT
ncbi:methyl-accepting chemotaxis protein [Methanoplanus sp. FWC-SCC4]|uniref:Methyl-accepting chemotaxis protein n=1 Tax=Methanochimaera problematica TaxID=2609417 RepID=A0AA97FBX3_9EURY|nr:methyl-accepting chemotaxis protein [Methanoplanus sp. FWC-SCC4]WOF16237.1 methyl-accepting chemotaxis protein [Methanoplanus sp. FWC-SCC4]